MSGLALVTVPFGAAAATFLGWLVGGFCHPSENVLRVVARVQVWVFVGALCLAAVAWFELLNLQSSGSIDMTDYAISTLMVELSVGCALGAALAWGLAFLRSTRATPPGSGPLTPA